MTRQKVVDLYIAVTPIRDAVLPTPSSRVVKHLVVSGQFLGALKDYSVSRDHYKPLFISCLRRAGTRLIYYRSGGNGAPVTVRAGTELEARVSAVVSGDTLQSITANPANAEGTFETPFGAFNVQLTRISISDMDSLYVDLSRGFTIIFRTPALLPPKLLLPPIEKIRNKYRALKLWNMPLPVPGLIFAHALRLWNSSVPEDLRLTRPNDKDDIYSYRVAIMGTALTEVIDYRLAVETVIIGRDENKRLRKARGFKGYISMNIHHKTTRKAMERALALAEHLGIGRSRGLGFGEIEIRRM